MKIGEVQRGDVVKVGKTKWLVYRTIDNFCSYAYKWPSKKKKIYEVRFTTKEDVTVWPVRGDGRVDGNAIVTGRPEIVEHLDESLM